jgi:tetratricopeptide (TPR) repeat protein
MPTRINGIGSAYIGQRNLQVQHGVCESCHNAGQMSSYETRLWFTVFFIPVIPLMRQQILNYCPYCTRHRAMPLHAWRETQTEAIGKAIAAVDANPESPDHAVECHATMAACGQREEAAQYAEVMSSRFSNNADVLMYLGGWFERIGRSKEGDKFFDQALKADPKHPGAQRAAAIGLIQAGNPLEAEKLLSSFMPPSKHFEPSVIFMLAEAYQAAGDHAAAVRLFKLVTEASPDVATDKKFRKSVAKSEAALGEFGSVLAPISWYKRRAVLWTGFAAAALAALIGFDRYFAKHREIFLVNGLSAPLKVQVDDGEPIEIPPAAQRSLVAAEGPHQISVIEPKALAHVDEFTVAGSIPGRWGGGQVHILDPARSAIVVWEESVYARHPADQTSDFQLHVGKPLSVFEHIDYKFEEFPHSIRVKGDRKVTKQRIGMLKTSPIELLLGSPEAISGEDRLNYLEPHLSTADDGLLLLRFYWSASVAENKIERCRDFLKKSLLRRPVDIDWHTTYQDAAESSGQHASLVAEYDTMISQDSNNADLLYLRARIEPYGADAAKFLDAALQKQPEHAATWAEKADRLLTAGKFEDALPAVEKAIAADPKRGLYDQTRRHLLFAVGKSDAVIAELKDEKAGEDMPEWALYPRLIESLCFQGNVEDAEAAYTKLVGVVDRDMPGDPLQLKASCRLPCLLKARKFDEVPAVASELRESTARAAWNFSAHLQETRLDEAAGDLESTSVTSRGFDALCLSLACRHFNKDAQANAIRQQAIALLASGTGQEQIVAEWLKEPPADLASLLPRLHDLSLEPTNKVYVLLALAENEGPGRDKLLELAGQLGHWPTSRKALIDEWLSAKR